MKIKAGYKKLKDNYLFAEIAKRVNDYKTANPINTIISLGIGDVTLPLDKFFAKDFIKGVNEMTFKESFKGYGPYEGYSFLHEQILNYYEKHGVKLNMEDVFVSAGAKEDIGNILDLFSVDNEVLIPSPVYPVYVDSNVMDDRKITLLSGNIENNFKPLPPNDKHADIIYLCSPNNPTGATYTAEELKTWVDYALQENALIIYDSAYEAFISDNSPASIYSIPGSRNCAIEICSFSKTAGFTGIRLGYTVIPNELSFEGYSINKLWYRHQSTKYNGTSYIIQKGASRVFTPEGIAIIKKKINYYKRNIKQITTVLDALGIYYTGGVNSPYVWVKCPNNMKSWDFFTFLLTKYEVVCTPGSGFGIEGEGFIRLTGFNSYVATRTAAMRLRLAYEEILKEGQYNV